MNKIENAPFVVTGKKISTSKATDTLGAKPQTARASLCLRGHWLGMRPVKLPNGRLLWDADEVERLATGRGGL